MGGPADKKTGSLRCIDSDFITGLIPFEKFKILIVAMQAAE